MSELDAIFGGAGTESAAGGGASCGPTNTGWLLSGAGTESAAGGGASPFDDVFAPQLIDTPAATQESVNDAQKRAMTVFMLIDTSGSMKGAKIGQVNQAIRETIPALKSLQDSQPGVVIQVALLRFATDAKWITPMPEPVDRFTYAKIEDQDVVGGTNVGFAFDLLYDKMSRSAFLDSAGGNFQPLILLISDGEPTDTGAWPNKLDRLYKDNMWFKASTKVAIAVEEGATTAEAKDLFQKFTGNSEMILFASSADQLATMIRLISVHASKWTTSRNAQGSGAAEAILTGSTGLITPPDPIIRTKNETPDWWADLMKDNGGAMSAFDQIPSFN